AKFKGTWNVIKLETSKGEEDKGKEISITFHDDGSVDFKKGSESKKGKYKLNLAAKPKEIDLIPDEGDDVGKGIYQFEKDKLLVGGGADEAALKKEKALFKGTWKIVKMENAKGEDDGFKGAEVRFDEAGNLELHKCGETKKATYKLNPKAKPKEIDITIEDDGTKTIKGIY